MAQNLTSRLPAVGATRQAEAANADWDGGMNPASNQCGSGINTGEYSPKTQDWSETVRDGYASQWLGGVDADGFDPTEGATTTLALLEPADGNDTFAFAAADADTAAGEVFDLATGAVNRTGQTVPSGAWLWGTIPVANA
jgi:hypothetical protein